MLILWLYLRFKVLQASCQPRCLQLWSAVYLAYPTPYSETMLENGDTSDYGDSVSSACVTPVSPVFPSANRRIEQEEEALQTCHVTASKSDGNLMCKDCLKQQQALDDNRKQLFDSLDRNLKSKSCPECRTDVSDNNIPQSTPITKDTVALESNSMYVSAQSDSCSRSVVSCEDSVGDIESSMSSSTQTVILDSTEGDSAIESGLESSEKTSESLTEETQQKTSVVEEPTSPQEEDSQESSNVGQCTVETVHSSLFNKVIPSDEEGTECSENCQGTPAKSSSNLTLSSSTDEATPSSSTLRPSSSELFTRYLDIDGLTYVSDPVQERLRQIEMAHQAKVEALQRQLLDTQRRRMTSTEGGTAGRTSDLADEVVCSVR